MDLLDSVRETTAGDFDYGGAASAAVDMAPLEEAVDEARRIVYALGCEMRRRSEGELPVWKAPGTAGLGVVPSVRTASAGL